MITRPRNTSRRRRHQHHLLAVAALMASASACSDPAAPTVRAPELAARGDLTIAVAPTNKTKGAAPRIRDLSLSSTTLAIGGSSATYTVTIQNNGSLRTGVELAAEIVQGAVVAAAGGTSVSCPITPGELPAGTCTMSFSTSASNTAVSGGVLTPGSATWVLRLIQDDGVTRTVLDSRSLAVTLVNNSPYISNLTLASMTLVIGGSGVPWTATVQNPTGVDQNEVFFQGEIVQGSVVAGANGVNVRCPPDSLNAILPPGTCTVEWTAVASNQSAQGGLLVAGKATFVLHLYQGFVGAPVELSTWSVEVRLAN